MARNAISYIKNVGKSVAFTTLDSVKEMVPVFNDFAKTNNELITDMYKSVKHLKPNVKKMPNKVMESKYGQFGKTYLANLTSDLKTGKFYNRERIKKYEEKAANEFMGLGDDSDFTDEDNGFNFDEMESWDDEPSTNEMIDIVGEKTSNAISNTMARSSEYIVQGVTDSNRAIYSRMNDIYGGLHSGMATINQNISKILDFSSEAVVTHFENSRNFYEESSRLNEERNQYLKEIVSGVNKLNEPAKTNDHMYKSNTYDNIVNYSGALNLQEYFKNVKSNINAKSGGIGDMISMAVESGMLNTLSASPVKDILETVIKAAMPSVLKESFNTFNDSLSSIAGNLLMKLKSKGEGWGLWNTISEIFGIDTSLKTSLNVSNYEKGKIPFDGVTKKAITDVIPTYLSKILSAINGQPENRFNYDTGKFVTIDELRNEFNNLTKYSARRAAFDIDSVVRDKTRGLKWDTNQQRQFEDDWENIKEYMYKNQKSFNTRDKNLSGASFGLKGGMASDINVRLLQEILDGNPAVMKYADQMYRERANQNRRMTDYEGSTMSTLFNGSVEQPKAASSTPQTSAKSIIGDSNKSSLSELIAIHKELSYIRLYGIGGRARRSSMDVSSDESRTPEGIILPNGIKPSFDDFNIPEPKVRKGNDKEYDKKVQKGTTGKFSNVYNTSVDEEVAKILKDSRIDNKDEKKTKSKSFSEKMHEAAGLSSKMSVIASSATELAKKPAKFIVSVLDKADQRLYDLIYGSKEDKEGNKSFAGKMFKGLEDMFNKFSDFLQDNIFDPLKDKFNKENIHDAAQKFFGMFGIDMDDTVKKTKEYLFGIKNGNKREGGIFSKFMNDFKDSMKSAKEWVKGAFRDVADWTGASSKKNKSGKEKDQRNEKRDQDINRYQDIIKNATARLTDATEAATGIKKVNKTGLAVISEGEAVIPPDMNPFNIANRRRNEKKVKQDLKTGIDSIFEYATGTENAASGKQNTDRDFVNKFVKDNQISDDQKDYNNRTKARIASDKINKINKEKEKYTKEDYEDGRTPFIDRVAEEIRNGFKAVFDNIQDSLGIDEEHRKENSENFRKTATDYIAKFKEYSGTMAAGGAIGAGVSVVTGAIGGPLLGAAVGAGIGLIKKSETVQKMLFGDIDEKGQRTGGIIPKEITNKANKYFGDMSKGATVGGILSMLPFVPGGPVSGIILGSAIGFAKNNQKVQSMIFGEDKLLGKKEDFQEKVRRVLPKMGAGALVGLLGGPFGLTTNILLGSALGFATDTDKFKDLMFGKEGKDGKREGGIMKAITDPAANFFKNMLEEVRDFIYKDMIKPVANAIDPIIKQFKLMGQALFGHIDQFFKKKIGAPIERFLKETIISPIGKFIGKTLDKVSKPVKRIVSAPFRAIGGIGNKLRTSQIKSGNADYMSAAQRNAYRRSKGTKVFGDDGNSGFADQFASFDASMEGMSDENIQTAQTALDSILGTRNDIRKQEKNYYDNIYNEFYSKDNNVKTKDAKAALKMIRRGSYEEAEKFVVNNKNIDQETKNNLLNSIKENSAKIKGINEDLTPEVQSRISQQVENLKNLGFDIDEKTVKGMLKGDVDVKKIKDLMSGELKWRDKNNANIEKTPVDKLNEDQQKQHKETIDKIDEIIKRLDNIKDNTYDISKDQEKTPSGASYQDSVANQERRFSYVGGLSTNPEDENAAEPEKAKLIDKAEAVHRNVSDTVNEAKSKVKDTVNKAKTSANEWNENRKSTPKYIRKHGDHNTDWENKSYYQKTKDTIDNATNKIKETVNKKKSNKNVEVVSEGETIISPVDDLKENAVGGFGGDKNNKFSILGFFKDISKNMKKVAGNISAMALKDGIDTTNIDDDAKSENYLDKVKNKFKNGVTTVTQFVDGLPLKFRKDKNGDLIPDSGNAENKDTYKAIEKKNAVQNGILAGITSIPTKIGGLFSRFFGEDEKKNKKSLFSKIFGKVTLLAKIAAGFGVLGWAREKIFPGLKIFWDEKLHPYLSDSWNGKKDGFGKFIYFFNPDNPTGLIGLAKTFIGEKLPGIIRTTSSYIADGASWAISNILPGIVSTTIQKLPTILTAVGKGVLDGINEIIHGNHNDGKMTSSKGSTFNFSNVDSSNGLKNSTSTPSWFDSSVKVNTYSSNNTTSTNNSNYTWKPSNSSNSSNSKTTISKLIDKYIPGNSNVPKAFDNMNQVYRNAALREYNKVKDNVISTEYGDMTVSDILNSDKIFHTSDGQGVYGYDMLTDGSYAEQLGMNIQLTKEEMKQNTQEDGGGSGSKTIKSEAQKIGTRALVRNITGVDVGLKAGSKIIKGSSKILAAPFRGILKPVGSVIKGVGNTIANTINPKAAFEKLSKSAEKNSQLAQFIVKVTEAIKGFFKNGKIINKISDALSSSKTLQKLGGAKNIASKFSSLLVDKVCKLLEQYGGKLGGKAAAKLTSYGVSGGVLLIADAVLSFMSGWRNANSILGITEQPSAPIKLVCGLAEAVNSVFLLGIVPLDIVVDAVVEISKSVGFDVFDDLEKQRKEAKEEIEAYNKEYGTDYSTSDVSAYNKKDRLWSKIKSKFSSIFGGKKKKIDDYNSEENISEEMNGVGSDIQQYATGARRVNKTGLAIVSEGEAIIPPDMNPFNIAKREREENKVKRNLIDKNIPQYASGTLYASPATDSNLTNNSNDVISKYIDTTYKDITSGSTGMDNSIKKMVSDIVGVNGTTSSNKKSIKDIYKTDYKLTSKNKFLGSKFDTISKIVKLNLTPTMILKNTNEITSSVITSFFGKLSKVGELSESDKKIIEKAKDGEINPFTSDYWKTSTTQSGIYGGFNKFVSLMNKVLNLPAVLIAYLNPINILKNGIKAIAEKLGFTDKDSDKDSNKKSSSSSSSSKSSSSSSSSSTISDSTSTTSSKTSSSKSTTLVGVGSNLLKNKINKKAKSGLGSKFVGRGSGDGTFISQVDSKYRDKAFNIPGDTERQTIGDSGCAPAAAAMAINSTIAKGSMDSMEEASANALRYKEKDDGVNANYFADEFSRHGMKAEYISSDNQSARSAGIMNNLARNNKVVLMGTDKSNTSKKNSPFGPNPHYVTATGTSKDGKYIYINDPESNAPNKKYSASKILKHSEIGIAAHNAGRGIRYKNISKAKSYSKPKYGLGRKTFSNPKVAKYVGRSTYGKDTAQYRIWARLVGAGFSEYCAAGIMGNMQVESGFKTNNQQDDFQFGYTDEEYTKAVDNGKISREEFAPNGDTAGGYGLCQWTYVTRKRGLYDYAKEKGVSISDLDMQLDYLIGECQAKDGGCNGHAYAILGNFGNGYSRDSFLNASSPEDACDVFYHAFEGPPASDTTGQKRAGYAREWYNTFKGTPGIKGASGEAVKPGESGGATVGDSPSGESGEVQEEKRDTPLAKILGAFDDLAVAYGLKSKSSSSSSSSSSSDSSSSSYSDSEGTVSSNASIADQQKAIVAKAKTVENKLHYSMSGARDPDQGEADCSSFVNWAYKKTVGKDVGGYTGAQTGPNGDTTQMYAVDEAGGSSSDTPNEKKLQLGDLLFYKRDYSAGDETTYPMGIGHVGMYIGNGKELHHPGPNYDDMGPYETDLSKATQFRLAMRLKDFKSSSNSKSSKDDDESTDNIVGTGSGIALQSKSAFPAAAKAIEEAQKRRKRSKKLNKSVGKGSYVVPYNLGLKHVQRTASSSTNDDLPNTQYESGQQSISAISKYKISSNTSKKKSGKGTDLPIKIDSDIRPDTLKNIKEINKMNGRASKTSTSSLNNAVMIQLVRSIIQLLTKLVTNTDQLNNISKLLGEYITAKSSENGTEQSKQKTIVAKQNLITALQGSSNSNQPNQDIMNLIETAERIAKE